MLTWQTAWPSPTTTGSPGPHKPTGLSSKGTQSEHVANNSYVTYRPLYRYGSVNDSILPELCSLHNAVEIIQWLGWDAHLVKIDIKNACQIVPIHPADHQVLGILYGEVRLKSTLTGRCHSGCSGSHCMGASRQWDSPPTTLAPQLLVSLHAPHPAGTPNPSNSNPEPLHLPYTTNSYGLTQVARPRWKTFLQQ